MSTRNTINSCVSDDDVNRIERKVKDANSPATSEEILDLIKELKLTQERNRNLEAAFMRCIDLGNIIREMLYGCQEPAALEAANIADGLTWASGFEKLSRHGVHIRDVVARAGAILESGQPITADSELGKELRRLVLEIDQYNQHGIIY